MLLREHCSEQEAGRSSGQTIRIGDMTVVHFHTDETRDGKKEKEKGRGEGRDDSFRMIGIRESEREREMKRDERLN